MILFGAAADKEVNAHMIIMFYTVEFGDTEFSVPSRYLDLAPKGVGAQGMVW